MALLRASFIALALLLGGCTIFPPRTEPNFFVLAPEGEPPGTTLGNSSTPIAAPLTVGVGPIRFPQYLDRLEMVTRMDDNRLAISSCDRWAAPLDDAFEKVLAQDLSTRLPHSRIAIYPWYGDREPDLQVRIIVNQFEVNSRGVAEFAASWTISDGSASRPLYSTTSALSQSIQAGLPNGAAALSHTLAEFAGQIALAIDQLSRGPLLNAQSGH